VWPFVATLAKVESLVTGVSQAVGRGEFAAALNTISAVALRPAAAPSRAAPQPRSPPGARPRLGQGMTRAARAPQMLSVVNEGAGGGAGGGGGRRRGLGDSEAGRSALEAARSSLVDSVVALLAGAPDARLPGGQSLAGEALAAVAAGADQLTTGAQDRIAAAVAGARRRARPRVLLLLPPPPPLRAC
jgi:hypothetical protein